MELRQLTYFVAVSDELSFSRAAAVCFISQSAISHQIGRLERELQVTLFDRTTRSVTLTNVGARLLPIARQMLSLEAAIHAAVREPELRVRLAANMSFAAQTLSAISRVRANHPDTEIEFVIKSFRQRIAAVAEGDCALELIRGTVELPGLRVEQLWVEDLTIAVAATHPLADRGEVGLAELSSYPLIMPPERNQLLLHKLIRAAFRQIGMAPSYGPSSPADHTATFELINRPDAWTVLYTETPPEGIAHLRESEGRLRVPTSAVLRDDVPVPAIVDELLDLMRR